NLRDFSVATEKSRKFCVANKFFQSAFSSVAEIDSDAAGGYIRSMLGDNRKRIILIDDHMLLREGLERLLNIGDEFVVCEAAGDAIEGMEMVRELRPDAVIVDVGLPGEDGIELTERLKMEF